MTDVHGTVYVSRGRGSDGPGRVVHTSPECHYLQHAADAIREVQAHVYPNRRVCSRCLGREGHGFGNRFGVPNGICHHCHGTLDAAGDCAFCERYAEVIELAD